MNDGGLFTSNDSFILSTLYGRGRFFVINFLNGLSGRSIAEVSALVNEYPSDLEIYLLNGSKPFQDVSL